jgi:hypothetical protein
MKNFFSKKNLIRTLQLAAFMFFVLSGLLGSHTVFAAGNVQPGGVCSTDDDCADQSSQSYGCYKNPATATTGTCTPDGDAPAASGTTAAQTQAQAAAQAACAAAAADPENKVGQANCQTATANAQSATPNAATTAATASQAAQQAANGSTVSNTSAGDNCGITNIGACVAGGVATVAFALASFAGLLLGWVGSLFNWIVVITIFQFGAYFGNSVGLLTAWGILRDLGNILLLFGFIFMGILMILDLESFSAGKSIARLIIVAVLLNFSLFAAEAVIDVADVLSASIYNQAGSVGCTSSNPGQCANTGIAAQVLTATGLNGIWQTPYGAQDTLTNLGTNAYHKMFTYIGMAFFMSVTMVVLLAATIMLVIRAVVLVFVMVLAPLGFAAMAIPPFANLGKQWRDMLISQAFFAPAYLLLLLVSLKIMSAVTTSLTANGNPATLVAALTESNTSFGTIFIVFALVIGFMIAALMTAKKMGAIGADFATSVATKTVRGSVLAPVRVGGAIAKPAARQGAGWAATQFGKNYDVTLGKMRKSNNPVWRGLAKGARLVGADEAITNSVESVKNAKFGNKRSYQEEKDFVEHRTDHLNHGVEKANTRKQLFDALAAGNNPAGNNPDAEKALQKMSQADFEEALKSMKETDRAKVASLVNVDKAEKIMGNDKISSDIRHAFSHDRYHDLDQAAAAYRANQNAATFTALKDQTKKLADDELKLVYTYSADTADTLSAAVNEIAYGNNAKGESVFSDSQRDANLKSKYLTPSQKQIIKDNKPAKQLERAIQNNLAADAAIYAARLKTDAGDISEDAIFSPGPGGGKILKNAAAARFADSMTSTKMAAIMTKDEWSTEARDAFVAHWAAKPVGNANRMKIKKYLDGPGPGGWWGSIP